MKKEIESNSLKNKVVIITGGAGLLGACFAEKISQNAGTSIIADIDFDKANDIASKINKKFPDKAYPIKLDINSEESIKKAIQDIESNIGIITSLINNAYPRNKNYGKDLFDVTYADFCENLSLNLGGHFLITKKLTEYFYGVGLGNVISISSIYGLVPPRFEIYDGTDMTMPVEYAAIKSAVLHLNKYFTNYTKGKNIRFNCVSPGGILNDQPQQFIDAYNQHSFSKGMLDPEDIASSVIFLLGDDSKYINGQNITVDDGWTL